MTSRSGGAKSTSSYVYESRRPRKRATNATLEPGCAGGDDSHSTDSMLTYHAGAFDGSAAYDATASTVRSIVISVVTSTGITQRREGSTGARPMPSRQDDMSGAPRAELVGATTMVVYTRVVDFCRSR